MEIDRGKRILLCFIGIFEANVFKIDIAGCHFHHRIFRVCDGAFFIQHLYDSARRFHGHGHGDKYHGEHHAVGEDLNAVCKKAGIVTNVKSLTTCGDDQTRCKEADTDHGCIDSDLHERVIKCEHLFCSSEIRCHITGSFFKFFGFKILTNIGFHYANTLNIFLYGFIERIVFAESALKDRHNLTRNEEKRKTKKRHERHIDASERATHNKRHYKRKNEHKRRTNCNTNEHHERLLHVSHVCCESCHKTGRGKFVDIGKGIILHLVIQIMTKIFREAAGSRRAEPTRQNTASERSKRQSDEDQTVSCDRLHFQNLGVFQIVDKLRRYKGDDTFDHHFKRNEKRRIDRLFPIALDTLSKSFQHK